MPDEREGIFEIIQRSKQHYQKRAYLCIKCMVQLFSKCKAAYQLLLHSPELNMKWMQAVDWLHEELEKVCVGCEECLITTFTEKQGVDLVMNIICISRDRTLLQLMGSVGHRRLYLITPRMVTSWSVVTARTRLWRRHSSSVPIWSTKWKMRVKIARKKQKSTSRSREW